MAQATLKLGSSGAAVALLQGLLDKAGFPSADPSGTFGPATDAAVRAFQAKKGLVADGIVGPKTWAALEGKAVPSFQTDKNAAFGREVLERVWQSVTGEAPNLAELQIAGAQAHLESNYGLAQYSNKTTGEKSGVINNWGAVQGGKPPCGAGGFEASDTHADGSTYTWCYKRYATPDEGAADMLKEMTVRRPTSWDHMKRGDIDAWAAAMRTKDPVSGVGLYFEQSAEGRAKGIELRVQNIAGTLGETVAAKRGGPVDPGVAMGQTPSTEEGTGKRIGAGVSAGLVAVGLAILGYAAYLKGWLPWR